MEKYQYFNGIKFTRDDRTGYYLNSTIRKRMHRYVWEHYYGEIPRGGQIHHKDKDRSNNDISNLQLVQASKHAAMHSTERAASNRESVVENLSKNAQPKAAEWHRSEEGRRWHKEHFAKMGDKTHPQKRMVCDMCGAEYLGKVSAKNRFCSNSCKSAWRRRSGLDLESRSCVVCGKDFMADKYKQTRTCSRACANRMRASK